MNNSTKWDVAEQGVMDRVSVSVTCVVWGTCNKCGDGMLCWGNCTGCGVWPAKSTTKPHWHVFGQAYTNPSDGHVGQSRRSELGVVEVIADGVEQIARQAGFSL